jgi:hypothetical protein
MGAFCLITINRKTTQYTINGDRETLNAHVDLHNLVRE